MAKQKQLGFTRKNPDGKSYRIPAPAAGDFHVFGTGDTVAYFGDLVNRLGEYEAIGTPEELLELKLNKEKAHSSAQ